MARGKSDRSLADWLSWQETLNPAEIDLGLDRVDAVLQKLDLKPPAGGVFTVAGTNGKGSTVAALDRILRANGRKVGVYTSPHLVRYNERIVVQGRAASDDRIVSAFERIEAARGDIRLTYFEYGTLAALCCFADAQCDAWVLEVGLGGRLDAVNVIAADFALITTVDLDHQAWLGDDIESIAAEKAGILRAGAPAFYGDHEVPLAVSARAAELGTELSSPDNGYSFAVGAAAWDWEGRAVTLSGLSLPRGGTVQVSNQALALAALEVCDPSLLEPLRADPAKLSDILPAGRCQVHKDKHEWLLDVAHNPQAGRALREVLQGRQPDTVVLGMLADKHAAGFVEALSVRPQRWLLCPSQGMRAASAAELARALEPILAAPSQRFGSVSEALQAAREATRADGLILVCGSFSVVGPALDWLGLYSQDTG